MMRPPTRWVWHSALLNQTETRRYILSLGQQYLLDLVAPPVIAGLWWLLSRGWATAVQVGNVSDRTRQRQKVEFFIVLTLLYVLMLGATTYVHFVN